mgnify:CR=1 FL=1
MSKNLHQASHEWATRPADQRFWTINEMYQKTRKSAEESIVEEMSMRDISFTHNGREILMDLPQSEASDIAMSKYGDPFARFTHYSFGQMCRTLDAPASYLRTLSPDLATDCLNAGLKKVDDARNRQFLFQANGKMKAKAQTSDRYERVWNFEIVDRLRDLAAEGWRTPPARPCSLDCETRVATEDDVIDFGVDSVLSVKPGDTIAPAGLYASDHDMFAFMVNPEVVIDDGSSPGGLRRGFMVRQSEVGDSSLWMCQFLFNTVCGNHIIWGVSEVSESRLRHVGDIHGKWGGMVAQVSSYLDATGAGQEQEIQRAKTIKLGNSKDEVLDFLFGKRLLSKRVADQSYDLAEKYADVHGDPNSVWGVVQGVTRLSQDSSFADKRTDLDLAAGKILAKALA